MAIRTAMSTLKPDEREKRLIHACEIANQDPEAREIEREFDGLRDEIPEPWEDALTR